MDELIMDTEIVTVIDQISHGEICPLETVLHYRRQVAIWEHLKKSVLFLDAVESALRKYGKQKHGTISMIWKRTYHYASCGDLTLETLEAAQTVADGAVKGRQAFLRSLTSPVFDVDGGCEIQPPTCKINRIIELSKIKQR
jgi:hypothetical protein